MAFEENKEQAWNTFCSTGRVEDYLSYNSLNKGDTYGNDKDKGDSDSANKNR